MSSNQRRVLLPGDETTQQERGAILVFVALGLVVLIGMMGVAIDLGHAYVNKSQLQNMADASALAGASALNGTADGIENAESRATDSSGHLANKTEFNTQVVTIPSTEVKYSVSLDGPWLDKPRAQADPGLIRFVQVKVPPQRTDLLFARVVPGIADDILTFGAEAVAGQEPLDNVCQGLDPFSPQALDPHDPTGNFGYAIGTIYAIRYCPPGSPCEAASDCGGIASGVTGNYGLANPDGLGLRPVRDAIVDGRYRNCITIEGDLPPKPGVGATPIVNALAERYRQDTITEPFLTHDDYLNSYLTSGTNFRRIVRVAFNDGIPAGRSDPYHVIGFGCFFMPDLIVAHPPSAELCVMYVGACDESGRSGGGGKASITRTVLFR